MILRADYSAERPRVAIEIILPVLIIHTIWQFRDYFSIDLASLKFAANIFDALVYYLRNAFQPTPMLGPLDDVSLKLYCRTYT